MDPGAKGHQVGRAALRRTTRRAARAASDWRRVGRSRGATGAAGGAGLLALLLSGCASVAAISNAREPACGTELEHATASVLLEEGEPSETANALAARTREVLASGELGPRPFTLLAPSGVDYAFFVDADGQQCTLRLYGRQKGFTSYTNNLTYIASRPLAGCTCAE